MVNNLNSSNKKLKVSFGANNFTSSKPSNGTYLRLILTSLSKKGNWGSLFRRFLNLSLESRKETIRLNLFAAKGLNPFNAYSSNFLDPLSNFKSLIKLLSQPALLNLTLKRIGNRSLFLLNNGANKKLIPLNSLRSVYSLFHPILVSIELKSKRRGGRVFSVPVPVKSDKRRHSIFVRWFKQSIIEQTGSSVDKFIANELFQLSSRSGKAMDRLVELDKTIKLNRVFLRKSQIKLI